MIESLKASLALARAGVALLKAQARAPGRPRIPGDGDGDGIPYESRNRRRGVKIPGPDVSHIGDNVQAARMRGQLSSLDRMAREGDWDGIRRMTTSRNHPYARVVDDRRRELMLASPRDLPAARDLSRYTDNAGVRRMRTQYETLDRYAKEGNIDAIRAMTTSRNHPYARVVDDRRAELLQHLEPQARIVRLRGDRPREPMISGATSSAITATNQRHVRELRRLADHHPNATEAIRAYSGISGTSRQANEARSYQQALLAHFSQGESAASAPLRPASSAPPAGTATATPPATSGRAAQRAAERAARTATPPATPPATATPAPAPATQRTAIGSTFRLSDGTQTTIQNQMLRTRDGQKVSLESVLRDRTRSGNSEGLHPDDLGFIPRPNVSLDARVTREGISRSGTLTRFVDDAQMVHARAYLAQPTSLQSRARDYQQGRWQPDTPETRAARAAMEETRRLREAEQLREAAVREATLRASVPQTYRINSPIGANVSRTSTDVGSSRFSQPQFRSKESLSLFAKSLIADYGGGAKFSITAESSGSNASIRYRGDDGTEITRNFKRLDDGSVDVYHAYFRAGRRGEGAGKQFFRTSMGEYIAAGVSQVRVTANIDVGGYAWARFGYLPADQGAWDGLRRFLRTRLDVLQDVTPEQKKAVTRILDKDDRRALWEVADATISGRKIGKELLLGSHWSGKIELSNEEQMRRFTAYVSQERTGP